MSSSSEVEMSFIGKQLENGKVMEDNKLVLADQSRMYSATVTAYIPGSNAGIEHNGEAWAEALPQARVGQNGQVGLLPLVDQGRIDDKTDGHMPSDSSSQSGEAVFKHVMSRHHLVGAYVTYENQQYGNSDLLQSQGYVQNYPQSDERQLGKTYHSSYLNSQCHLLEVAETHNSVANDDTRINLSNSLSNPIKPVSPGLIFIKGMGYCTASAAARLSRAQITSGSTLPANPTDSVLVGVKELQDLVNPPISSTSEAAQHRNIPVARTTLANVPKKEETSSVKPWAQPPTSDRPSTSQQTKISDSLSYNHPKLEAADNLFFTVALS